MTRTWATLALTTGTMLAALLVLVTTAIRLVPGELRPSDDWIWMYVTGVQLHAPRLADQLDAELIDRARSHGTGADEMMRLELRRAYRGNYFLISFGLGALGSIEHAHARAPLEVYAQHVAHSIINGAAAWTLAGFALLAVGVFAAQSPPLSLGLLAALTLLSGFILLEPEPGSYLFFRSREGLAALQNIAQFALNPSGQFSVFGFSARACFLVLALLVFAWRWNGWRGASYSMALATYSVHQSMATMLLASLLMLDAVLVPRELLRPRMLVGIVVVVLVIAWRESLWRHVAPGLPLILGALAALFAVAGAIRFSARCRVPRAWFDVLRAVRVHMAAAQRPGMESLLLLSVWLATLPIGYLIARRVGMQEGTYFWYQLHARVLSLYEPVILFGFCCWLFKHFKGRRSAIALLLAATAMSVVRLDLAPLHDSMEGFHAGMLRVAEKSAVALAGPVTEDDEAALYFALAHTLQSGEDQLRLILPARP